MGRRPSPIRKKAICITIPIDLFEKIKSMTSETKTISDCITTLLMKAMPEENEFQIIECSFCGAKYSSKLIECPKCKGGKIYE